jgi:hypothetical protein
LDRTSFAWRVGSLPSLSEAWNIPQSISVALPTAIMEIVMGRGLLLWLIGIPIPIILLIWLLGGLHG